MSMRVARLAAAAAGSLALVTVPVIATVTATTSGHVSRAAVAAVSPGTGNGPQLMPGAAHARSAQAAPPTTTYCEQHFQIACFEPGQVQQAYNLPPLYRSGVDGRGQTIVVVDSFGSPTIAHDLSVFDQTFSLPAPPSLQVIQPAGKVPPFNSSNSAMVGWAGETTLDVEYAHAIAPAAKILLVETPVAETEGTTGFPQIVTAEQYVINHHLGGVISQSFSATEETFSSKASLLALRGAYQLAARNGVTVLAATGDSGAADVGLDETTYYPSPVTTWPPSDPLVTGVGGTQLHLGANGRFTAPTVWNDTYNLPTNKFIFGNNGPNPLAGGGGKSVIFGRPSYQNQVAGVTGNARGVPDISMSGACNGAVDVYQSFPGPSAGWYPTCGTSEATPLFAGIVSLADQVAGHPLGPINPALYAMSGLRLPGLVDVTQGNNTVSFTQGGSQHTVTGFAAGAGYDLASGVGTVNALAFVPELAALAGRSR
jgi:subtilase family serine protease